VEEGGKNEGQEKKELAGSSHVLGDVVVPAYSYVRVHEHPKRHLAAARFAWPQVQPNRALIEP
jgi:hypothetical protein